MGGPVVSFWLVYYNVCCLSAWSICSGCQLKMIGASLLVSRHVAEANCLLSTLSLTLACGACCIKTLAKIYQRYLCPCRWTNPLMLCRLVWTKIACVILRVSENNLTSKVSCASKNTSSFIDLGIQNAFVSDLLLFTASTNWIWWKQLHGIWFTLLHVYALIPYGRELFPVINRSRTMLLLYPWVDVNTVGSQSDWRTRMHRLRFLLIVANVWRTWIQWPVGWSFRCEGSIWKNGEPFAFWNAFMVANWLDSGFQSRY